MTVSRMNLSKYDEDYIEVSRIFNKNNQTKKFRFEIESIEKVDNPVLWRKFEQNKTEYQFLYGHVKIVKVFHGTKKANIRSILNENLQVQRHGQNIGHRFGAGVAFSAFASYSSHYCDDSERDNQMLLCYVLVSNIVEVPEKKGRQPVLTRPPFLEGQNRLRYDTTAKDKQSLNVIVKFDNHTFYPAFVIHFKRVSKLYCSSFSSPLTDDRLSNMPRHDQIVSHLDCLDYSQSPRGISSYPMNLPPVRQDDSNVPLRNSSALPISQVHRMTSPVSTNSPPIRNHFSHIPSRDRVVATSDWVGYSQPSRGISSSSMNVPPTRTEVPVSHLSVPSRNSYSSVPSNSHADWGTSRAYTPSRFQYEIDLSSSSSSVPTRRNSTFLESIRSFFQALCGW